MPSNGVDIEKQIASVIRSFNTMIEQQWTAINSLLEQQLVGPALILTYATIDIMASLNLEKDKQFVTRADFKQWVNRYLLPHYSGTSCSADDLYSARCGLLHSYSPESRLYTTERPLQFGMPGVMQMSRCYSGLLIRLAGR